MIWLLLSACSLFAGPDLDQDGLSDADEVTYGSDPQKPDSDKDGLKDGEEIAFGSDPNKRDTDGDGVTDARERDLKTNPREADERLTPDIWLLSPKDPLPTNFKCGQQGASSACFAYVPGGTFQMGAQASDPGGPNYDPAARPDEGPVHGVTVSPFWILKYEVQSDQVGLCLGKGWCHAEDYARGGYMNVGTDRRNQPANGVTWEGAQRACAWMGGRLPTEAEWEFAARGTEARRFPWGELPRCGVAKGDAEELGPAFRSKDDVAETECAQDGTAATGQLRGASPFGVYGLAGNVWEWVSDWYAADAYAAGGTDPQGPATGEARAQRGGGWTSADPLELRSAARGSQRPDQKLPDVGFRCVRPVRGDAP